MLPEGCFVNVGDGLYISTPEFCFLQMANEYSLASLMELGLEICGSYSLPTTAHSSQGQESSQGAMYDLQRLTSIKRLETFCSRMQGWPGVRKATKALRYIADGSASPKETILFILLVLPYKYGGYGLPIPELNGRIVPEKSKGPFSGRGFYRGDLVWREARIVAEYNSGSKHADPVRMSLDAIRRNDLALVGYSEITVTWEQLRNMKLFDKVARQIASGIGRELRYKNPSFSKICKELRRILF